MGGRLRCAVLSLYISSFSVLVDGGKLVCLLLESCWAAVIDTEESEYIDFFFFEVLFCFCWQFSFECGLQGVFRLW